MNDWQHLPNAPLIDWVISSLGTHRQEWADALAAARDDDAAYDAAWVAAWDAMTAAARHAAGDAARTAAWDAMTAAARHAAGDAARTAAWDAVWDVSWGAIIALIAYDDCDQYLSMSYDELLTYAILSERPQAVLLPPLKWIQENYQTVDTV